MENYIVSARKYRPTDFKTVVGQQSITTTLKNSIKSKQLAHAYLFCGPRGVGKTTCARIFAKIINCNNPTSEHEACNECESCIAFNEQRSYNIHELDAASNNSVEDIRYLIEQVRIPPQIGTHSVYIIDEVHMLSSQAFNAFLKTLEEPPSYAIFVLATTEKHKILPTILSRCQIFDFNRIKVKDTVEYLAYVAKNENVDAEIDALNIIAQKSDGAMRDALSFFDQLVSFSGNKISYNDTIENLNVLDYDYYFKLTDLFLQNNISGSLLIYNEILDKGFDGHHFITGLSSHFRDLMVCKDSVTIELLEVGSNIKQKYLEQSTKCNLNFLLKAIDLSNQTDLSFKESRNKRLQIELALMKMCSITEDLSIKKKTKSESESVIQSDNQETTQEPKKYYKKEEAINKSIPIKKSGISINGKTEKSDKEKIEINKENTVNIGSDKFSQEQLEASWTLLINKFEKQPRLFNALKNEYPKYTEDHNIELKVSNNSLEQVLIKLKPRIISFLKKELNNNDLDIIIKVDEYSEENSNHLYTNRDKYKYLISKNPNLEKLKNDFELEF